MLVMIDGVEYVPWRDLPQTPSTYKLTLEHIAVARNLVGGWDALLWALDNEASVEVMQAWNRAIHADKVAAADPKRALPLPVPGKKPVRGLFES